MQYHFPQYERSKPRKSRLPSLSYSVPCVAVLPFLISKIHEVAGRIVIQFCSHVTVWTSKMFLLWLPRLHFKPSGRIHCKSIFSRAVVVVAVLCILFCCFFNLVLCTPKSAIGLFVTTHKGGMAGAAQIQRTYAITTKDLVRINRRTWRRKV